MLENDDYLRVWQVELGNRSDLVFMLRDFLQRNGMKVDVSGPASLAVTTGARRAEVVGRLAQWEAVTNSPARLAGEPKITMPTEKAEVEELLSGKTDLTYTVAIEVVPPIQLADFKSYSVEKPVVTMSESRGATTTSSRGATTTC